MMILLIVLMIYDLYDLVWHDDDAEFLHNLQNNHEDLNDDYKIAYFLNLTSIHFHIPEWYVCTFLHLLSSFIQNNSTTFAHSHYFIFSYSYFFLQEECIAPVNFKRDCVVEVPQIVV